MTAEERLRQSINAPRNTVAVSPQVEALLRQRTQDANIAQQVRQIDSTRRYEAQKKAEWDRGR